jgi:hypothetical protein
MFYVMAVADSAQALRLVSVVTATIVLTVTSYWLWHSNVFQRKPC